jgi:aromatic ring-opening dioxygenase catalytic subunit (LigB family)
MAVPLEIVRAFFGLRELLDDGSYTYKAATQLWEEICSHFAKQPINTKSTMSDRADLLYLV